MDINDECSVAVDNVRLALHPDRRLPRNVFVGDWSNFLFFDSDWMFDVDFVTRIQRLLEAEGGTCACLRSLDSQSSTLFAINAKTTPEDYRLRLVGHDIEDGWNYDIGRFACASNTGDWCMYCERAMEIGVVALRRFGAAERYRSSLVDFHAAPLSDAIREPLSYGFSNQALTSAWRSDLLREYAGRSR